MAIQWFHDFLETCILSNTPVLIIVLSGNPPQCKAWAGQCFLYLWAVIVEKATITLLVQLSFWEDVRKLILLPVKNYPKVELAISMLIIPFVFNVSIIHEPRLVDRFLWNFARKLSCSEDLLIEVLRLCPPANKDLIDCPHKFLVLFFGGGGGRGRGRGCKCNARLVSHEAMH